MDKTSVEAKASQDGRRNNKPPEHGKIKPREVRNPYGRGGKPKSTVLSEIDQLFWQEGSRTVSHDAEGPVDAKRRMVQEEFFDALGKADAAARVRVLGQLRQTAERIEQSAREERDLLEHFMERKMLLTEGFYQTKLAKRKPPDVIPHPDHVVVSYTDLAINGPIDVEGRALWERVKAAIRIAACQHAIVREEYGRNPSRSVLRELKAIETHRRQLMRVVPKGWNWREEIYCRDSMLDFAKEVASDLERIGYVSSDADD